VGFVGIGWHCMSSCLQGSGLEREGGGGGGGDLLQIRTGHGCCIKVISRCPRKGDSGKGLGVS
jgi:hypothetical protein